MSLQAEISTCWREHGDSPQGTLEKIRNLLNEITNDDEVSKINRLLQHLFTDHLKAGPEDIEIFKSLSHYARETSTQNEIKRSVIFLNYFQDPATSLAELNASELVFVHAAAASAHGNLKNWNESRVEFNNCIQLAADLPSSDSSHKQVAVTGNNIACSLEEKDELTTSEKEFLIAAAKAARKHWEIAGTWLEVERAEYRLSKAYLKIRDFISSIKHANLCLTICETNKAAALELFFAFEAIACVEKLMGQPLRSLPKMQKYYSELSSDDQKWCESSIKTLEK